jgi:hypothetical protein
MGTTDSNTLTEGLTSVTEAQEGPMGALGRKSVTLPAGKNMPGRSDGLQQGGEVGRERCTKWREESRSGLGDGEAKLILCMVQQEARAHIGERVGSDRGSP